jgi:hypothetical protein
LRKLSANYPFQVVTILLWLLATCLEGLVAAVLVFSAPGGTGTTRVPGLSSGQFAILAGILFLVVSLSLLIHHFWRHPEAAQRVYDRLHLSTQRSGWYGLFSGISFLGLLVFSQLFHLGNVVNDPYVRGYLVRLQPILFWGLGLGFHTLLALPFIRYGVPDFGKIFQGKILRISAAILIVLLLLGIGIAISRVGIEPDKVGWDAPGVPVIPVQAWLVWGSGLLYLCLETWLGLKKTPLRNKLFLDLLVSLLFWGGAFILWSQEPLTPDYFAPEPRAPNYEFYPYSDAALHDVIAQELLVGVGFPGVARKPLYALFLALLHGIAGQDYLEVIKLQVAVLATFPVLLYWMGKGLHQRISGFIAGGLIILRERNAIALSGEIRVSHAKLMMSDLPATLAVALVTWLVILWLQNPTRRRLLPIGIGGGLGLLLLLRPQFILLVPAIIVLVGLAFIKRPLLGAANLGLVVVGLVLTLSPWLWRSYQLTGKFTLNDPSQNAFLTEQYSLDPGGEMLARPSGVSEAEYIQLVNDYLKQFVLENPGVVAGFVTSHFVHNEIEMVQVLPMSFWVVQNPDSDLFPYWRQRWERLWSDCCSVQSYVESAGYWDPIRENIRMDQVLPLLLNLMLVCLGLGVSWYWHDMVGWVPLGLSLVYSLSTAVGRYSGWRLILPADWVLFLYFAIGIGQLTLWLSAWFTGREVIQLGDTDRKPTWVRMKALSKGGDFPLRHAVILSFVLLGIGLIPLIVEFVIPPRYFNLPKRSLLASLMQFDDQEIEDFLIHDTAVVAEGRALYPRYYKAGEGEPGKDWAAFIERNYDRLGFSLVGPENGSVILPLEEPPESFPNGSDVIVVGCQEEDYIDAAMILVSPEAPAEVELLVRPSFDVLTCPLLSP